MNDSNEHKNGGIMKYNEKGNTIQFEEFESSFDGSDRAKRFFSPEGKRAIFDYFADCGQDPEDADTIIAEYAEYGCLSDFHLEFGSNRFPDLETLRGCTTVILCGDHPEWRGSISEWEWGFVVGIGLLSRTNIKPERT